MFNNWASRAWCIFVWNNYLDENVIDCYSIKTVNTNHIFSALAAFSALSNKNCKILYKFLLNGTKIKDKVGAWIYSPEFKWNHFGSIAVSNLSSPSAWSSSYSTSKSSNIILHKTQNYFYIHIFTWQFCILHAHTHTQTEIQNSKCFRHATLAAYSCGREKCQQFNTTHNKKQLK